MLRAVVALLLLILGGPAGCSKPPAEDEAAPDPPPNLQKQIEDLKTTLKRSDLAESELQALKSRVHELEFQVVQLTGEKHLIEQELASARERLIDAEKRTRDLESRLAASSVPSPSPSPVVDPQDPEIVRALGKIALKSGRSMVSISAAGNAGFGFFVTPDGLIVAPLHVVRDARPGSIIVSRIPKPPGSDHDRSLGEVIAVDEENGLCLLSQKPYMNQPVKPGPDPVVLAADDSVKHKDLAFTFVRFDTIPITGRAGLIDELELAIDGVAHLRISMPLYATHDGLPVFDAQGQVIGLVRSPVPVPSTYGTAVPVRWIRRLVENRERMKPEALKPPPGPPPLPGIDLGTRISHFISDSDGSRIFALDAKSGDLLVISLVQGKVLRKIPAGADPVRIRQFPGSQDVWVLCQLSSTLLRIDPDSGRIRETVTTKGTIRDFVMAKGDLWWAGSGGLTLAKGGSGDREILSTHLAANSLAYDGRRDRLIWTGEAICEADQSQLCSAAVKFARVPPSDGQGQFEAQEALKKLIKQHGRPAPALPNTSTTMFYDARSEILIDANYVYRVDKLGTAIASLGTIPPQGPVYDPAPDYSIAYPQAVSKDGRWVVSGYYLMDLTKKVAPMKLPHKSPGAAFSTDLKTLIQYNAANQRLEFVSMDSLK